MHSFFEDFFLLIVFPIVFSLGNVYIFFFPQAVEDSEQENNKKVTQDVM